MNQVLKNGINFLDRRESRGSISGREFSYHMYNNMKKIPYTVEMAE